MNKWGNIVVVVVVALVTVVGCSRGGVATVRRDNYGGVLALQGREETARNHAARVMQQHCGPQYTVLLEERVVIGSQTQTRAHGTYQEQYDPNAPQAYGQTQAQATTTSSDMTELHVHYRCGLVPQMTTGGEVPAPVMQPMPAPAPAPAPAAAGATQTL